MAAANGGGTALPICRITYKKQHEQEVAPAPLKTLYEEEQTHIPDVLVPRIELVIIREALRSGELADCYYTIQLTK
jgi:hypothetical protein